MTKKMKVISYLFLFILFFINKTLHAQIIVPYNADENISNSTDFDCLACRQIWKRNLPITVRSGEVFSNAACGGGDTFEVAPGGKTNLTIRFTDRDSYQLKGCGSDDLFSLYYTPEHTVVFKITGSASFTPYPNSIPMSNALVSAISISEDNSLLSSGATTIYFDPDAVEEEEITVLVSIVDNADIGSPTPPATEVKGSRTDPDLENAYKYTFVIKNNEPQAIKEDYDDTWRTTIGIANCIGYDYTVLDGCPLIDVDASFENKIITEELSNGTMLFSISDIKSDWLITNNIDPELPNAINAVQDILFSEGFFGNPEGWAVCGNTFEDCHGGMLIQGLNLSSSTSDVQAIFTDDSINQDRAGYSVDQVFYNSVGASIGTAKIYRAFRYIPPTPISNAAFGVFIKKEHNVCTQ